MKHATSATLDALAGMLDRVRRLPGLHEVKPGVFYRKSRAFLHFHEDGGEVYADVRLGGADFERMRCTGKREQAALVTAIGRWLKEAGSAR